MALRDSFTKAPFAKEPHLGAYVFALLVLFTGVFSIHGDLLGKTLIGVPASAEDATEAEAEAPSDDASWAVPVSVIEEALRNPKRVPPVPPEHIDAETLWLARCIYSETKRPKEQELVAWVVRNRVETAYRGQRSYHDVVLDAYQFSAFNPNSRKRRYYSSLGVASKASGWKNALALAFYVRHAPATLRPFSSTTRHFYSEGAMTGRDHPEWVTGMKPVTPARPHQFDAQRFRFYAGVM